MKRLTLLIPLVLAVLALAPLRSLAGHDDDDDDDDRQGGERRGGEKGGGERRGGGEKGERGRGGGERHGEQGGGERRSPSARGGAMKAPGWAQYQSECGTCHLAYPPGMLPAASWQKVLGGLDAHFGQNAEVDTATRAQLQAFLASYAAPAGGPAPLRITELAWWRREHDELGSQVYARKAIGTAANCAACHTGAEQGSYDEHGVRVPVESAAAARPAGTR